MADPVERHPSRESRFVGRTREQATASSACVEGTSDLRGPVDDRLRGRNGLTILAWILLALTVGLTVATIILTLVLRQHHLSSTYSVGFLDIAGALGLLVLPSVGVLIVTRHPENTIGWLFVVGGFIWGVVLFAGDYTIYGAVANPGSLPGTRWSGWVTLSFGTAVLLGIILFLPFLFPNGKPPTRRWRPIIWMSGVVLFGVALLHAVQPGPLPNLPVVDNPLGLTHGRVAQADILQLLTWTILVMICVAMAATIVRFRHSRGVERQQLTWFTYSAAIGVVGLMIALVISAMGVSDVWVGVVTFPAIIGTPIATGIAILRYRLYAIELLINRTLVYSVLTAILALIYAASIILLQVLVSPFVKGSSVAVAGSTLLVAAMFQPARIRVQASVDRRFYRRKYDAARTLDAFSAHLRDEIDLDSLSVELCSIVHDTMQTERVSLWLRPVGRMSPEEPTFRDRS